MMVAVPAATPVTRPLASTVAAAAEDVVHVTARPVSTLPAASFVTAESCVVFPMITVAAAGVIDTEATAGGLPPPLFGDDGASPSPLHAASAKAKEAAAAAVNRR